MADERNVVRVCRENARMEKGKMWICRLGILLFFLLICYVNLFHYTDRMNADIASEAVLGRTIWESRQWIPDSWYPSTEVRVVGTANLSALFYGITGDMGLSMGLSCIGGAVLIIFSMIFMVKASGGSKSTWGILVFLMLALPADYSLLEVLYVFAGYYAGHVAAFFFTLGVYGGILRRKNVKRGLMAVSILLGFLLGMQGSRGMLVIYGPLFAVEAVRQCSIVFRQRLGGAKRENWELQVGVWVLGNCLFNFLGSRLPISVSFGFSRNIRRGLLKLWEVVIPDIASVLGFYNAGTFGKACFLLLLFNACFVFFGIVRKFWEGRELTPLEWVYLVTCASPVMTALMVSFTTVDSTGRYYFVFFIMLCMAVVLLFLKERRWIPIKLLAFVAAGYLILANLMHLYLPMTGSKELPETEYTAVTDFLEEKGIGLAYATFENANTMTVLSKGRVQVASVASVERMDICKWLSCTNWYPPEAPRNQVTAYLVTESQMPEFMLFLKDKEIQEAEQMGRFHIFISDYNYTNME